MPNAVLSEQIYRFHSFPLAWTLRVGASGFVEGTVCHRRVAPGRASSQAELLQVQPAVPSLPALRGPTFATFRVAPYNQEPFKFARPMWRSCRS